jgi:hypothetical protein
MWKRHLHERPDAVACRVRSRACSWPALSDALDHENPEVERVVDENRNFAVVETFVGEASRIPEEPDPRRVSGVN